MSGCPLKRPKIFFLTQTGGAQAAKAKAQGPAPIVVNDHDDDHDGNGGDDDGKTDDYDDDDKGCFPESTCQRAPWGQPAATSRGRTRGDAFPAPGLQR